jgi:hypothetical protein
MAAVAAVADIMVEKEVLPEVIIAVAVAVDHPIFYLRQSA